MDRIKIPFTTRMKFIQIRSFYTQKILPSFHHASLVVVPLLAYVLLTQLLDFADWNHGVVRSSALFFSAWSLYGLSKLKITPSVNLKPWALALAALLAVRAYSEGSEYASNIEKRRPIDIGTTTEQAVKKLDRGESIYATVVDPQRVENPKTKEIREFKGYKYGSLMPRFYGPFLKAYKGHIGLYVGNLVLFILTLLLSSSILFVITKRIEISVIPLFGLLWPSFIYFELFNQGINDLLPEVFALGSFLFALVHKKNGIPKYSWILPLISGIFMGFSMASKPLPGSLYLLLLPALVAWRPLLLGTAVGLLAYLPDFLQAPGPMFESLVLFNIIRNPDTTSLMFYLPKSIQPVCTVVGLLAMGLILYAYYQSKEKSSSRIIYFATALCSVFLCTSKIIHRNYLLWWTPMMAMSLAILWYEKVSTKVRLGEQAVDKGQSFQNTLI